MKSFDVIVIGAGAAGLMAAITAAERGKTVLIIEHAKKIGRKILMSGGGRCNFTNMYTSPENFLSENPHFCKSALNQFNQWQFIERVEQYKIPYHEKTLGQLFCDNSSKDIVDLLLKECQRTQVRIETQCTVNQVERTGSQFQLATTIGQLECGALIVATGGLSIPSMGPHGFGYKVARQFGLPIIETRAGLVPFVMSSQFKTLFKELPGTSLEANVANKRASFTEGLLITHKGLSGPSILQMSSYWKEGEFVDINWAPELDVSNWLLEQKIAQQDKQLKTVLSQQLSKRLSQLMCEDWFENKRLADFSNKELKAIGERINCCPLKPDGTEGYKTAEVTLGGVDTDVLSSKSMMVKDIPGLFFIGETIDVTGHLGGFNFQWAWSSGYVAGQNV